MYNDDLFLKISGIYKVLADPTRLKILFNLKDSPRAVKDLMKILNIKQANLSKHLSILKNAGIVKSKRDKNNVYYSFSDLPLTSICDLICDYIKEKVKQEEKALGIK